MAAEPSHGKPIARLERVRSERAWQSAPRRLGLGSLRWRLAAWVAAIVVISSGLTFYVVYRGTGSQVRAQINHDLTSDASALIGTLGTEGRAEDLGGARQGTAAGTVMAARRFIASQPFTSTSTILFVRVPGQPTVANTPELVSARSTPDDGESSTEQSAENRSAAALVAAPTGFSVQHSFDEGELRVLERGFRMSDGRIATIGVGESLAVVARAERGVAQAFILAAGLALLGALIAALLIGTRFSAPLRRMAAVAKRVDAGELTPRIDDPGPDDETRALADSFNHMLDRLTDAFAGQREFVADASHELRTPLTVIQGQLEVLAAQREPTAEEVRRVEGLVRAEVGRMNRLVDDLLLLARAEQAQFLRVRPIALRRFVEELWAGVGPTADRRFELGELPTGTLIADPDRLAQALRNLIENAIEHTSQSAGHVRLEVVLERGVARAGGGSGVVFAVEDDGPGIPPEELERVFERFHRTDPARSRASGGIGLGLAIVRAIAEAHGGSVEASRGRTGGARIELSLPRFTPQRESRPRELVRAGAAPAPR
ncbi:MAG: sensor histidine kinase [Solirubrobacteraceae bacterium]